MWLESRKSLGRAGEIFCGNSRGKFLVIAKENEIWLDCPHGGEEVFGIAQANLCLGIRLLERCKTFVFILLG